MESGVTNALVTYHTELYDKYHAYLYAKQNNQPGAKLSFFKYENLLNISKIDIYIYIYYS